MFNRTTDGSNDNEAVKIVNALKPFWKKWTSEWGRNCVRSKKMTVSTAPSVVTGLIGVTDAFSDTECMIPYQNDVANAKVGDTVWVRWMYDNQQTMYAESMGDISVQQETKSGTIDSVAIASGEYAEYNVTFDTPFVSAPVVVASLLTSNIEEIGSCTCSVSAITTTGVRIRVINSSSRSRTMGARWIAVGVSSNTASLTVTQNATTGNVTIY